MSSDATRTRRISIPSEMSWQQKDFVELAYDESTGYLVTTNSRMSAEVRVSSNGEYVVYQFFIDKKAYRADIEADRVNEFGHIFLRPKERYYIARLEGSNRGYYAFIRQQDHATYEGQLIIVQLDEFRTLLIETMLPPFPDRKKTRIRTEKIIIPGSTIVGVVEAILYPSSASTVETVAIPCPQILKFSNQKTRIAYRDSRGKFIKQKLYEQFHRLAAVLGKSKSQIESEMGTLGKRFTLPEGKVKSAVKKRHRHSRIVLRSKQIRPQQSLPLGAEGIDRNHRKAAQSQPFEQSLQPLTTMYLKEKIFPFLEALEELQQIIDIANDREPINLEIKAIRQNSPISIGLKDIAEALQVMLAFVLPWRHRYIGKMENIEDQERLLQIETIKLDLSNETRSESMESEGKVVEPDKRRHELRRDELEIEKYKMELLKDKIDLAADVIGWINPPGTQQDRTALLLKLMPTIEKLVSCDFEIEWLDPVKTQLPPEKL